MNPATLPDGQPPIEVSDIETAIHQRVGHRVTELIVRLDGQAIVLSGLVDCYYTKQLVVAAVLALPGYRVGANLIRVKRKTTS